MSAAEQLVAKGREARRIVELVAVDAEHPCVAARVLLDQRMRVVGMMRPPHVEMVDLAGQPLQDLPGPIRRDVVERVDTIAERGDVADRLLHEYVLVPHEDDADDLRRYGSSVVHSSMGRTAPRHWPWNMPRAESPSAGS